MDENLGIKQWPLRKPKAKKKARPKPVNKANIPNNNGLIKIIIDDLKYNVVLKQKEGQDEAIID